MPTAQEQFDDAMFDFSMGAYDDCIAKLRAILLAEPEHFDAQLALGMAYSRKGDFQAAITEGHKAEKLRPQEQLVHTNLSLFYMKAGDKQTAEHHGLQARISSWRGNMAPPGARTAEESELTIAAPPPPPAPARPPLKPRDMPWKKKSAPPAEPASAESANPNPHPAPK
jgi:tetratricopeptide (TPR) repeat protein